ncbi:MAG TPA: NnrS family protein [Allosphingosinicella sp.]|jgi:uncharacterized protein involved in response to NO
MNVQTRGERMLALRRARTAASPAFLRGGFRPFFFGAAAWAVVALVLWLAALAGGAALPTLFEPLAWHRHEMLFGFVGAAVAGFLLTAIPNWTGRLPIAGPPLACLFGLWLAARLALLFSAWVGALPAAMLDVGFFLLLAALAGREVLAAKNRNLPIVGLLLLFAAANAADHAAAAGFLPDPEIGWRAAIALVVLLISLIGGRIIPSFTRNWLAKRKPAERLPTQPGRFDRAVVGGTALALLAWLVAPEAPATALILLGAGFAQAVRLARWRGFRTLADPLVFILHAGYFWVPIGLLLLGASGLGTAIPRSAAVHALTAGAMGTMILAVMTRATLGHTGRDLKAGRATVALYGLATFGAGLRVAAPLGAIDYPLAMKLSASAWAGALLLFLFVYGPMLFQPRTGEAAR